ncbi:extensin family protein [Ancylobacter sp. WKF20]|uniref:extensin family protein n=1 Tax=Ancylobacter sp. WKF20 TaxID=3039801 RepID=UPI0024344FC2|nr:extensin family protein [Ancylobacter sp. WKF20]WGD29529.1 extensin family protein [Ancylobacter sp. WKF20]
MDFPRLPSRRACLTSPGARRLPALAAVTLMLATPAAADPLKEIGSGFDEAGRALNRQVGAWFSDGKPARTTRRRLPATAPLPLPRPAEGGPAASAALPTAPPAPAEAPPPPAEPSPTATAPTPPPAPDAVRVAALPAPGVAREAVKPTPSDRQEAQTSTEAAAPVAPPFEAAPPAAPKAPALATPSAKPPAIPEATRRAATGAADVPRPTPRPAEPESDRVAALPPAEAAPAEKPSAGASIPTICPELSAQDLGAFTPITVTATDPACAVDRGVSLTSVRLKDGRSIPLQPAAVLRCEMAASVAHWLRDEVDPAAATLGSKLSGLMVAASQQCRPRNRVAGAKISEHGRGNAIDVRGLMLEDGRRVVIGTPEGGKEEAMPLAFRERLKMGACADFTTILGPGSDDYHEQHLHLDRAERRSGAVLCQWAVAGPPPKAPGIAAPQATPTGETPTGAQTGETPTPAARPAEAPGREGAEPDEEGPADEAPTP